MGLTDLLKNVGRALTLTAALYSCGGEEKEGCSTDYDCREPRVCVRGYCEDSRGGNNGGYRNGAADFCEEYRNECPHKIDFLINECRDYCNEISSPRDQPDAECAFIACAAEIGVCDNEQKGDPEIISCARDYGWNVDN